MNALRLLASLVFLTTALTASAQNDSLSWFTIDGGGGACSNGTYLLQGTIGQCDTARMISYVPTLQGEPDQPDAGALLDSTFKLYGGYWPGVLASFLNPLLAIRREGSTSIILSWPVAPLDFVLQGTTDFSAPDGGWTNVIGETVVVGANYEMTLRAAGGSRFFRLAPAPRRAEKFSAFDVSERPNPF